MLSPEALSWPGWDAGGRWVSESVPRRLLERDGVWQEALLPPVHRAPERGCALGVRRAEGH